MKLKQSPCMTRKSGQGMTEYIVIVALVAIAAIAVYQFFGQTIRAQTSGIALELSGQTAQGAIDDANRAGDATRAEREKKGLDRYQNDGARR